MFRTTQVTRYIRAMEQWGIDRVSLLAGSGIDVATVNDPETWISHEQYAAVVTNMHRLTGDSGLFFHLCRTIKVSDFGLIGYAMITARTLREVTELWIKYSDSLIGQYCRPAWGDDPQGNELVFHSPLPPGLLHRFEIEQSVVGGIKVVQELTGVDTVLESVAFAYPAPPHRALYDDALRCPLQFDAPQTVVRLLQPTFDTPVKTSNEEIFSLCAEHCSRVMTLLPSASDLLSRLRTLFLAQPSQLPDLHTASLALGMSPSTLLRKLDACGHSYQSIKDQFRYDLAREYLRSEQMAQKQVAYLLGFSSPSNFYRAFKAWSGMTVGAFLAASDHR